MGKAISCIYCGNLFDPFRGEGDHVFPVQLGEFRNDVRFRRICSICNNKIGQSEQQFLLCGPERLFRDIVKPKIPNNRKRNDCASQIGAQGAPPPQSTIDMGDHRQLVRRSKKDPQNVYPIDQIVIHDSEGKEYFIELYPKMSVEQLKSRIDKRGIKKIKTLWLHCIQPNWSEFEKLIQEAYSKSDIQYLPGTEAGITRVEGAVEFEVNDHYFRAIAKIAFHYYLSYTRRGFQGNEPCFGTIRHFIMNGGDMKEIFGQTGLQFAMPFGELSTGDIVAPTSWCHVIAADENEKIAAVYLQLFVGPKCIPKPHYIKIADINSKVIISNPAWGHVYLYDESSSSDRYTGRVEHAEITRVR